MSLLSALSEVNLGDPWTISALIGILVLLILLIESVSASRPTPIRLPCRLHRWDVRGHRYVCGRCGFIPSEGPAEADQG